jgi:primase-polymerase (primpol)-like protein
MTRPQAEQCARERGHTGIGIMFDKIASERFLGGIDLDSCFADDGGLLPWAQEIFDLVHSYAEISPSGTGLKLFSYHDGKATLKERWRKPTRPVARTTASSCT